MESVSSACAPYTEVNACGYIGRSAAWPIDPHDEVSHGHAAKRRERGHGDRSRFEHPRIAGNAWPSPSAWMRLVARASALRRL